MRGRHCLIMANKIPIVSITAQPIQMPEDILGDGFETIWCDARTANRTMSVEADQPLLDENALAAQYENAIFIIDTIFLQHNDVELLGKLPANQIFYQIDSPVSIEMAQLLDLRGAFAFDISDGDALAHAIRYYCFIGSDGYRSNAVNLQIGAVPPQSIKQFGRVYTEINVDFNDWELIAYPDSGADKSNYIPAFITDRLLLDHAVDGDVELKLKVNKFDLSTHQMIGSIEKTGTDIVDGIDIVGNEVRGYEIQAMLYAKGHGRVRVGNFHMRRSRGPYGNMMPNDERIVNKQLHDDVVVYFDAGDLKPPLNVYFSGWRTKEGYEGNRMMKSMGAPYILVADQRLKGGAFYMGNADFERELLCFIQSKLNELNFDPHDVILSGMSMGTFGAMYYGSQLAPRAIVVGKPLTNLGDIAQNGRVKRPDDFNTIEDIQLYHEGDLSDVASKRLNERFWRVFSQGDFSDTTLALAYMEQDDYDDQAFYDIQKNVKAHYPNAKILSRGFEGRHNDNTADVVAWFRLQYGKQLEKYGRKWSN